MRLRCDTSAVSPCVVARIAADPDAALSCAARTGKPLRGSLGEGRFRIFVPRKHPAEQVEAGTLAPAIVCTVASPGACGLRDLVAHGKQHVAAEQKPGDSLHESASTNCATLGDPASPCGVE